MFVTYDGSSQAAGVKIYINGELQDTEIAANQLNNTIRTTVPLKVGQRHTSARLDDVGISDVRIHRQVLTPDEIADLVGAQAAPWRFWASPASSVPGEDTEALLVMVAEDSRSRLEGAPGQASCPASRKRPRSGRAGPSPT